MVLGRSCPKEEGKETQGTYQKGGCRFDCRSLLPRRKPASNNSFKTPCILFSIYDTANALMRCERCLPSLPDYNSFQQRLEITHRTGPMVVQDSFTATHTHSPTIVFLFELFDRHLLN